MKIVNIYGFSNWCRFCFYFVGIAYRKQTKKAAKIVQMLNTLHDWSYTTLFLSLSLFLRNMLLNFFFPFNCLITECFTSNHSGVVNEPPLPRRKKCPELAYRTHEFITGETRTKNDINASTYNGRARVSSDRYTIKKYNMLRIASIFNTQKSISENVLMENKRIFKTHSIEVHFYWVEQRIQWNLCNKKNNNKSFYL